MTLFALVDKRKNKIIGSICYSNCNQQDMLLKFGDIKRQVGKKISFMRYTKIFESAHKKGNVVLQNTSDIQEYEIGQKLADMLIKNNRR